MSKVKNWIFLEGVLYVDYINFLSKNKYYHIINISLTYLRYIEGFLILSNILFSKKLYIYI